MSTESRADAPGIDHAEARHPGRVHGSMAAPAPSDQDETPSTEQARSALGARMSAVVDRLLRGEVLQGFDELRSRETARILALKRVDAMAYVRPEIALLPRWRPRAVDFVLATPNDHCAHWDWQMFVEWVRDHSDANDTEWLSMIEVFTGRRQRAVVRFGNRRHYVRRVRRGVRSTPALPV